MILGQVSYLDCIVFLVFLAPQLLIHVGILGTVGCALKALPFLVIKLPITFIYERFFVKRQNQTPFVQQATPFEDFVIRCVRYAFANIPASIGRVFFSKPVALPFLRFRMLRHGYLKSPIHWHEVHMSDFKGLWLVCDEFQQPDVVVFYAHGGGFSMGSSYFYLEFLLAWLSLLKGSGFKNPAIFALEYTLVPDTSYPTQLHETIAAYKHVNSIVQDSSRICVAGDSAGATLTLSHLLYQGRFLKENGHLTPGMAVLISPWATLVSSQDKDTLSDYLNAESLHLYAHQYAGSDISLDDPLVSPGKCKDIEWWIKASPSKGFFILFGAEEVFAPEIHDLVALLKKADVGVDVREAKGGIHAWPVAALFLSNTKHNRQLGLKTIVRKMQECLL